MVKMQKRSFIKSVGAPLATYNFTELATGTGYITLYLGSTQSDYVMSSASFYSQATNLSATSGATTDTIQHDIDYDVLFNNTRTLKGEAIVSVPLAFKTQTNTSQHNVYAKIYIRKWDGSTETEIANGTSATHSSAPGNNYQSFRMSNTSITIPQTRIKKGEYLRITIELHGWISTGGGQDGYFGYAQDPKNRTSPLASSDGVFDFSSTSSTEGQGTDTNLLAQIPFKISE